MKKLHLVCNAHLDPMWQWEWEDGAAAALATFYSAVKLAEDFDYIFCHNEVVLYEYVRDYDPALFDEIKGLVAAGKWQIMGGWYLQPDCNMPAGESFVRQIQRGKQFFLREFGSFPKTAINFDSFGHSVGLVQIIKKCGQENYLFCRPMPEYLELEDFVFQWKGLDGSILKACRIEDDSIYCSGLGRAVSDIKRKVSRWENADKEVALALWGVGNHGGGPSRKDLADILAYRREADFEVVHSTPDAFFDEVRPAWTFDRSLQPFATGCYSSMSRLKQRSVELENQLFVTEKICSVAALRDLMDYPQDMLSEAQDDLLYSEFHDLLPGTCIRDAESACLCRLDHGLDITAKLRAKAFFRLAGQYCSAKPGDTPVFVFNPFPYEYDAIVECEISMADLNGIETVIHLPHVLCDGNELPSQTIEERSYINYERMKRMLFRAKLKPFDLTRFDISFEKQERSLLPASAKVTSDVVVSGDALQAKIDGKTGLLTSLRVSGREFLRGGAFAPYVCRDDEDPWGWAPFHYDGSEDEKEDIRLSPAPDGLFSGRPSVSVIEDGSLCTEVESLFRYRDSSLRIGYRIYKDRPMIDVGITVFWNEVGKRLKLLVPSALTGDFLGQVPFGTEVLPQTGAECVTQRFNAIREADGTCLAVLNDGTFSTSCKNGDIRLTLLRAAAYCAHPILDRPLVPQDRLAYRIENGEHRFHFRLTVCKEVELERLATEFNQKLFICPVFPHAIGPSRGADLWISNPNVVLVAFKSSEVQKESFVLRLLNNTPAPVQTNLSLRDAEISLSFGKFEAKTLLYHDGFLSEVSELII